MDTPQEDLMHDYLKDAAAAGELIRVEKGALPEHATVPLVVYINGERKIIGEATVEGDVVKGVLGAEVGEDILTKFFRDPEARFSLGFGIEPSFDLVGDMNVVDDRSILEGRKFEIDVPSFVPGCTCPWNNGYLKPGILPGHHINCPWLKKKHTSHDSCGPEGHRDSEVSDDEA